MNRTLDGRLTRRARILDAAIAVIAAEGAGASYPAIASRAEVSPSLITYHFRARTDLLAAVADALDEEMNEVLGDVAVAPTPADGLRLLVERFLLHARVRPEYFLAARALVHAIPEEQRRNSPAIAPDRGIPQVSDLITAAQADGDIPPGPVRPLATALMGTLQALAYDIATSEDPEHTDPAGVQYSLRLLGLA